MRSTDTLGGWYPRADRVGIPDTNFAFGNQGRRAVVIHVMDSTMLSTISWFANSKSKVSAHFGIDKRGNVKQFVSVIDSPYSNGLRWDAQRKVWFDPVGNALTPPNQPKWQLLTPPTSPNLTCISVEREGHPSDPITPAMLGATVDLLKWLGSQYPVLLPFTPLRTLVGHSDIAPIHRANCPGPATNIAELAAQVNKKGNPLATHTIQGPNGSAYKCGEGFARFYAECGGLARLGYALMDETQEQDCTWLRLERAVLRYSPSFGLELALISEAQSRGWI